MDLMDFQVKKKCPESYALGSWLVKLQPRRGRRGDRPTATTKRSYYGRSNTTNATIQRPRKTPYHSQHYRGKLTRLRRFCPYELQRFPPYDDYGECDAASEQYNMLQLLGYCLKQGGLGRGCTPCQGLYVYITTGNKPLYRPTKSKRNYCEETHSGHDRNSILYIVCMALLLAASGSIPHRVRFPNVV